MNKNIWGILTTLLLLGQAGNATAAIIESDLAVSGDGLLIEDTVNGMQWFDWSQFPAFTSVDDFFSSGVIAGQGFHLATRSEIETLFTAAGADNFVTNGNWNGGGSPANVSAIDLLNSTTDHLMSNGWTDTNGNSWIHARYDNGGNPDMSGLVRFNSICCGGNYGFGLIDFLESDSYSDSASTFDAQFSIMAVRSSAIPPVPVPAAVWLFGTALLGLAGFGKRKSGITARARQS